jgi:hypothetical protein
MESEPSSMKHQFSPGRIKVVRDLIEQAMTKKMAMSLGVAYDLQSLIGTMPIELARDPLTTFALMAR